MVLVTSSILISPVRSLNIYIYMYFKKKQQIIEDFAPNLERLILHGNMWCSQNLGKFTNLEEAWFCLKAPVNEFYNVFGLLCSIRSAKVLTISAETIEVKLRPPLLKNKIFCNLNHLKEKFVEVYVLVLFQTKNFSCLNMQAFKEGSMAAPRLDNICKLKARTRNLNDDLVPALVSLLRGMPNLKILYTSTNPFYRKNVC